MYAIVKSHGWTVAWLLVAVGAWITSCGCRSKAPSPEVAKPAETSQAAEPVETNEPTPVDEVVPSAEPARSTQGAEEPVVAAEEPSAATPEPTWSTLRMVCLGNDGPTLIEIAVNIDDQSLEVQAAAALASTRARIAKDLPEPWSWEDLLKHPLVRSGWLGNLMPSAEQTAQVVTMYNTNGDSRVDDDELAAFLTRGLARSAAIRFSNLGTDSSELSATPWGVLDVNRDNRLDPTETSELKRNAFRLDTNGDRIITAQELRPTSERSTMAMQRSSSMLDVASALAWMDEKSGQQVARNLLNHYTFLDAVPRSQWPGWDDKQWNALDTNADGQLQRKELESLDRIPSHVQLKLAIFDRQKDKPLRIQCVVAADKLHWDARTAERGQLNGALAVAVSAINSYSPNARTLLRQQLAAALNDPQLQMLFRNQLQLSEEAFKVLDADGDQQLSDEEFNAAWEWLTAIRANRLLVRYSTVPDVWFRAADRDGDNRITEAELNGFEKTVVSWDRDQDGSITPNEAPLAAKLELVRTDERLVRNPLVPAGLDYPTAATTSPNWVSASDSNGDGVVSGVEFLGSSEDFRAYDRDNDGFITSEEAYGVQ